MNISRRQKLKQVEFLTVSKAYKFIFILTPELQERSFDRSGLLIGEILFSAQVVPNCRP